MKKIIAIILIAVPSLVFSGEMTFEQKVSLIEVIKSEISTRYVMEQAIPEIEGSLNSIISTDVIKNTNKHNAIAKILATVLQKHDKHFTVKWRDPKLQERLQAGEGWFSKLERKNSGFNRIEILEGNVAYIDFWGFDNLNEVSRRRAETVMEFTSEADALIFDVRGNGGGSTDMVRLLSSYLLTGRVQLNSFYWRASDATTEFWTFDHVNGKERPDVPVFVLIDNHTFSAAEEFAYNLQALKRATIVGEVTKGGANPWQFFDLIDGFQIGIPIAKAINPITKGNWEGVGVQPDVLASGKDALEIAHQNALGVLRKR